MERIVKEGDIYTERYRAMKRRWLYVILGIIIMVCLGTVYSWSIFRVPIERYFNIGTTLSGLPYMVSLAFYSVFMFLTGKHLDTYSPRLVISIGALLVASGWILSAYAPNIYILTLTYGIISGAGVGIAYGVPMAAAARWFPEKKGLAVGLVLIGFGLSPLVTAPLAELFLETQGIRKTFQILGISFGTILPLLSTLYNYPPRVDNKNREITSNKKKYLNDIDTAKMLKSKSFKGLYLNFMIGTMIGLMIIGITSNIGVEMIRLQPRRVAFLISMFAVFNGAGRPVFGWLTDKLAYRRSMLVSYGLIITAALFMLFANEGDTLLYSIAFSIFWFNLGGWLAIAPTSTLALYGTKHYSQNYGVVFTAYGIGAIIGVLVSGLLKDMLHSYDAVFYFVITLCIVGIFTSQKNDD